MNFLVHQLFLFLTNCRPHLRTVRDEMFAAAKLEVEPLVNCPHKIMNQSIKVLGCFYYLTDSAKR